MLLKGNAAAERVIEILEARNSIKEIKNPINKNSFDKELSFKNHTLFNTAGFNKDGFDKLGKNKQELTSNED